MAEREQGITIDVAYRYFTTDNRSFIVADTPGHEEYTRNMAVGASFADLAVILVDAKQGVLIQTKRHARICALMGIKHFVFAVNKMDLVGYSEERFNEINAQIAELTKELSLADVVVIPVSATEGDNVTTKSANIPWYKGKALLPYLEQVDVDDTEEEKGFYMPVQRVCRPNHEFRGFQGQIEAGSVSVGDEIITLPTKEHVHVKSIHVGDKEAQTASIGQPVTIQLDREVDVSRGSVLAAGADLKLATEITATILWMDALPDADGAAHAGTRARAAAAVRERTGAAVRRQQTRPPATAAARRRRSRPVRPPGAECPRPSRRQDRRSGPATPPKSPPREAPRARPSSSRGGTARRGLSDGPSRPSGRCRKRVSRRSPNRGSPA